MGSKKHRSSTSNLHDSATFETPRGGDKKKKVKKSVFADAFANPNMLKAVAHTDNDGWMQVQAKDKKKPIRRSIDRTFSGVGEEELRNSVIKGGVGQNGSGVNGTHSRSAAVGVNGSATSPVADRRMSDVAPVHTAAYYSDDEIQELVRHLAEASDWEEALEAIRAIRLVLKDENQAKKADAATKLFKHQVVPALVLKLQKYGESSDQLTEFAARILVQLTYFEPTSKSVIAKMGGIRAIYDTAQHYKGDMYVSGNVTVLFSNLALAHETRQFVSLDDYIDYVLQHMREFPDEPYTQRICCKYLANIGIDEDVVERLFDKEAMPLVALAYQNHRKDDGVRNVAKETLQIFLHHDDTEEEEEARSKLAKATIAA